MRYTKPAKTISELKGQLLKRGLIVSNPAALEHDLKHIGYFRLAGYMYPYQIIKAGKNTHKFKPETEYKTIQEEYIFDRKLRRLYLEAIEHIEVFMRSTINDYMSVQYGAYWFLNTERFNQIYSHSKFLYELKDKVDSSSEKFMRHFREKYSQEEYPPSWMVFELITFGALSMLYKNLSTNDREKISTLV